MRPIKVLIVDDSTIARSIIASALRTHDGIEVVGFCQDGTEVPEAIEKHHPDLITLDIEMPKLNGPGLLKHVLRKHSLPVIMVSSMTTRGAQTILECLALGAIAFILKPNLIGSNLAMDTYAKELIEKVLTIGQASLANGASTNPRLSNNLRHESLGRIRHGTDVQPKAILIGASTGGPGAVEILLSKLDSSTPPILVAIHMPMQFTKLYAERLNKLFHHLEVRLATHHCRLDDGVVYIAPGHLHLELKRGTGDHLLSALCLGHDSDLYRPSIDRLFSSAAKVLGPAVLACVLTGMGRDGVIGAKAVLEGGGIVLAQDEASSAIYGMPRSVFEEGLASMQLSLNAISTQISSHLKQRSFT